MSIESRLDDEMKAAMRSRDSFRLGVIRFLRSEVHNEKIRKQGQLVDRGGALAEGQQMELSEDEVIGVLSRLAQQRRDSIEAYEQGNRQDLVDKESAELAIVLEYLPQQMSADEIAALATKIIEEMGARGPQDMGKVMGRVMPQVRGKAEGRQVSEIVSNLLKAKA
ncbi:MAG: GatB/YqeY domain-containing protein [Chloroflexi bacterium]|nr:GatB/YqeY domain-containing protein [Chloroflexota bacterium]